MPRIHIPKLEPDKIGVWNQQGWYLDKHELNPSKDIVIFQCQFGHGARLPAEISIGKDGTVDPMFQCHCLKFKESMVLDGWPDWWYKLSGKDEIVKLFAQAVNL